MLAAAVFFFLAMLCYSQSGNDPQEDLARFGYKLNMKVNFLKNILLYFWLLLLEPRIETCWRYSLNFDRILAIENLKMNMILAHLIF